MLNMAPRPYTCMQNEKFIKTYHFNHIPDHQSYNFISQNDISPPRFICYRTCTLLLTNPIRSWHWMLYKPFTPFAKELMTERQVHKNLKDPLCLGSDQAIHACMYILYRT